jgi:glycosyltransferase involved in cell wall biosynthesis/GT2 family glycosyltransferase
VPPEPTPAPPAGTPPISVLICAYTLDRLDTLAKAIESVQAQTSPAHEIVLAIDHSPELLAECKRRWPGLRVVESREEEGLSGTRNAGVAACAGQVVAFLDDDATAAPEWLARLGEAYDDPAVLGVGGAVRPAWEKERPGWFPPEFDWVVGCTHSGMPQEPATVRNLVGANMSFRREVLTEVGGFRHELGRVGTIPAGCEETDLCIRIRHRRPDGEILYDPAAAVDHAVPVSRSTLSYFVSRCRGEGRSKAILTGLVGSDSGLEEERSYVRRTLPRGVMRGIGDALRGRPSGMARAATIASGLFTTAASYAMAGRQRRRLARRRERAVAEGPGRDLRVLMVTPRSPLAQGGVERHVMEVSRRLATAGLDVEVLCTEPGAKETSEEHRDGVTIRTVRAWPANRDWCFAPRIWREMSRRPWDVVHIQSYHTFVAPLAMLRALRLGIPYVVTFHGGGHSSEARNRARGIQRRLLRPLLSRAQRLVAIARFEIEQYGNDLGLPPEKFVLIPNGADLAPSTAATTANGRPEGPPAIASIGRLERYKGHHRVIAAFPYVLEREPAARLMVVGTGPYEPMLREQAGKLGITGSVDFTSTPPDQPRAMAQLLQRISLVVLLSDFETHPLVALEAAAAGRRLLVADTSGLSELAEQGLARAIPVDEGPAEVGRTVLEELKRPPPAQRPQLPSWDDCAEQLRDLYRSVI